MRKLILWIGIMITMMMIATAMEYHECQRVMQSSDIPCSVISSWKGSACNSYEVLIYNITPVNIMNLTFQDYPPNCMFVFNITSLGTYQYNSSLENGIITIEGRDDMVGLGVIIFLVLLNAALFILPYVVKFTNDEVTNLICKRSVLLLAMAVLAFVTTIIITMADRQGLGITQELFVFQWIFLNAIYVGMILLFFSFFVSVPKLWADKKKKERMGEE